jgi:hypothetical protein
MSVKLTVTTKPRWSGVRRAAKALGCSPAHLTYVLHGQRKPGKELAQKLARMGVHVREAKITARQPKEKSNV